MTLTLSCSNTKNTTQPRTPKTQKVEEIATEQKEENFYGFKFNIPQNWQKTVSNFKAVDLKGQVKTIETDYQITGNDMVRLVYHPGKSGVTLFNNYRNSRRKNLFQTNINKMPAVKLIEKIDRDGKGHLLSQPMTRTKIFVLDPRGKGSLEIVFDFKDRDKKAVTEFESFLKSLTPAK